MDAIFDIFKRLPDGKPLWIESVEGLPEAKERLHQLACAAPGEYFIFSERSGGVIESVAKPLQNHQAA